ncbi:MAG: hypothetical protein ACYCW6_06135 [Candidatus Xenobia bacterium]
MAFRMRPELKARIETVASFLGVTVTDFVLATLCTDVAASRGRIVKGQAVHHAACLINGHQEPHLGKRLQAATHSPCCW